MNYCLRGVVAVNFVFNPDAEEFVPKAEEHRHSGERDGCSLGRGEAGHHVGKQAPRQRGRERWDWDGLGRLNPAIRNEGMHRAKNQRAYIVKEKIRKKRRKRRRGRTERRLARFAAREARARQKEALGVVATYNVRTLAVKGRYGYGHAECVLAKVRQLSCDFVGVQETKRAGKTEFSTAGYRVFCSGQEADGRQGLHGVGLAIRETICRKSVYTQRLIDERLMSMRFELTSESVTINLVVAYAPTEANPNTQLK